MGLDKIEHIVVLVMENRSFDHMLGYLGLEGYRGADGNLIDGLRPGMSNPEGPEPTRRAIFELEDTRFDPGPHHEFEHVEAQLADGNQGFVNDYATHRGVRGGNVMGYYTGRTLPVFDQLVRRYAVCDRWFCSVPGPTWPNRFFLMAGHSGGITKNLMRVEAATVFDQLTRAGVSWQYYSHDIAFLRTVEHFTFTIGHVSKIRRFYEAARAGRLPQVSWLDPNFTLQGVAHLPDGANDDHPPADVRAGQNLVADVYNALISNAKAWARTLFVVVYDEHGGFFDHVPPPSHPERAPMGDPHFARFGVRVPALVVSPWVRRGTVWSTEMEHTTILRTMLVRFCGGGGAVPSMGARADGAPDLGHLLDAPQAREDAEPVERMPMEGAHVPRRARAAGPPMLGAARVAAYAAPAPEAEPVAHEPSELERRMLEIRRMALEHGVPDEEM